MMGLARGAMDAAGMARADRHWGGRRRRAGRRRGRPALELLYRRHAPWLAGRLAARTSSRELAEEALQDTFWPPGAAPAPTTAAGRSRPGCGGSPAGGWPAWPAASPGSLSLDAAGERVDPASGPEEAALGRDASTRIRLAVAHLPDDQQAVITAVVYQGQTITQAARATGVAEGTIKSRLHQARLHIRKELKS